jgi:hypothetical protein
MKLGLRPTWRADAAEVGALVALVAVPVVAGYGGSGHAVSVAALLISLAALALLRRADWRGLLVAAAAGAGGAVVVSALLRLRAQRGGATEGFDAGGAVKPSVDAGTAPAVATFAGPAPEAAAPAVENSERREFVSTPLPLAVAPPAAKAGVPSEGDDAGFHLDAGTTFLNAYKSLKPEQVASMTRDTQELMETQKQLMATLKTLSPLIADGKQMMGMFQQYFGTAAPTTT